MLTVYGVIDEDARHGKETGPVCGWCHLTMALAESRVVFSSETLHQACYEKKLRAINSR